MTTFHGAREAKEFLASRIVEEAQRENILLSEVERKMLYFSETHWTLPDMMEVYEQFEREYDPDEYERKITRLIGKAATHDRKESAEQYDTWLDAIRILEKEDHYILVMVRAADLRPRRDQLKLLITGLSIVIVLVSYPFFIDFASQKYGTSLGKYLPSGQGRIFYLLVIAIFAGIAYRFGWLKTGRPRT